MARISDAVLQGLMNPQFGFTGLAEPIGMLMGGAQAQRQAQQRQMGAIQGALGAQDIGGLQGVLGGLRTPEEAQTALSAFGAGQQARAQEAAAARENSFRAMVKRTAPSLGAPGKNLLEMADTADIEDLRKSFGSLMENFKSNEGILTAFEVPPEEWFKYLGMQPTPLLNLMKETQSFGKGTPRDYRTPDGRNVTYVTNARGQVRVPGDPGGTWVNIEDAGLQPAVRTTESIGGTPPVEDVLGKSVTNDFLKKLDEAESSFSTLENNKISQQILSQQPAENFGVLANFKQLGRKFGISFGFANLDQIETEAQLNAFQNSRIREVASEMGSGTFGSGSAVSNTDREYADKMAGQDLTMTKDSLGALLYLERKLEYAKIQQYNDAIRKRIIKLAPEEAERLVSVFEIPIPENFHLLPENIKKSTVVNGETLYLDWIGVTRRKDGTIVQTRKPKDGE